MKFNNPANDYIEEVSVIAWFWIILFDPFYFAFKGMWGHAIGSVILAALTAGISWLIYHFFAKSIMRKYYLRYGWIEIG